MIFEATPIAGAYVVRIEPHRDERGFFARVWCEDEASRHGLPDRMVQSSLSHNRLAGTLRGLHFSWPPSTEAKLVRCVMGRILDVIVDLRPRSPSLLQHVAIELDDCEHAALFIPPGVAHGFQTLADDSCVLYQMSERFQAALGGGVRHDDPLFGLRWPLPVTAIAARDRDYPDFDLAAHTRRWTAGVA